MYIVLLHFKDQTETVLSEMTIKQPFYIIHHIIMYVQVTCSDPDFLEAAAKLWQDIFNKIAYNQSMLTV